MATEMTIESILVEIRDRLASLEAKIEALNNPVANVSAQERGRILAEAMASGDKQRLKATIKQINGR